MAAKQEQIESWLNLCEEDSETLHFAIVGQKSCQYYRENLRKLAVASLHLVSQPHAKEKDLLRHAVLYFATAILLLQQWLLW